MEDLITKINALIEKQPKRESLDCYDDHGMYYDAGYYEGYVEGLTLVLGMLEGK